MSLKFAAVEDEYEKCKDLKKEDVHALLEWADKQAHLPRISELEAILFLQACYYSNEAAKKALDNYYTIRTHSPEIFSNQDPEKLISHLKAVMYAVLPKTTKEGYKILYSKIVDPCTDHYVCSEQLKIYEMTAMIEMVTNGTNEGEVIVLDMHGSTIGHMARMNLLAMKKFLYYVQEGIPLRLKRIHVMNAMPFTDKLLALIRPFMKKELLNILHVHVDMDSLYKFVPSEALPDEYGGTAGTLKDLQDLTIKKLLGYREFFVDNEKLLVDESKRAGKPKNPDEIFGVEGTFKKLDID